MPEPRPDRVDVDSRPQQMDGSRVSDHVRADPLAGKRRNVARYLSRGALDQRVDAETRDAFPAPIEEDGI